MQAQSHIFNSCLLTTTLFIIALTIYFNQSTYHGDEDDGPAQPVLVLSNPSSTDITISVFSTDGSATGKDTLLPSTLTH